MQRGGSTQAAAVELLAVASPALTKIKILSLLSGQKQLIKRMKKGKGKEVSCPRPHPEHI